MTEELTDFDTKKIYRHEMRPREVAKLIKQLKGNRVQVIMLPTSKKSADILIRDIPH